MGRAKSEDVAGIEIGTDPSDAVPDAHRILHLLKKHLDLLDQSAYENATGTVASLL